MRAPAPAPAQASATTTMGRCCLPPPPASLQHRQRPQRIPITRREQQRPMASSRASSSSSSSSSSSAPGAAPAPAPAPRAATPPKLTLRHPATPEDLEQTRRAVLREAINPLGLDAARTLVAADPQTGAWIGSGQLSRSQRAPWQQQQAAAYELRSLVVAPERRDQGVGSALVRGLLDMAEDSAEVFLTTTTARASFYRRAGAFEECALSEAPPLLVAEVAVGTFVAAVVARQRLVVMRRKVM